jgi:hypothetical protein
MKVVSVLIVCISFFATTNSYAGYNEDLAAINKGMPKQVKSFNKRQIECNHLAGEEPYDKARLEEINAVFKKLRCSSLEKDEKNLLKKYKAKPKVLKSIHKAKEFY